MSSRSDDLKKAEHEAWVEGRRREVLARKRADAVNAGATPLDDGSYIPKDVPWLYASTPSGASLQERLYCLRQNARRSLPGLIAIEARIRSGKESLEDFPHFTPWLRDFLFLAREARVLGLPAAWEWGLPKDVAEVRRAVEQLAQEAERDLTLVKERSALEESGESAGAVPLSKEEMQVLSFLAECDVLQSQQGIIEGLDEKGHPLSKNPVVRALKELSAKGLVHRPQGPKKGFGVTPQGRRRAAPK